MKNVKNEFQVHKLNEAGLAKATQLAEDFSELLAKIEEKCPPSRERSLVVTKLQEASFWAKRSIAVLPDNQER